MKQEEITEGNILIAEFMGFKEEYGVYRVTPEYIQFVRGMGNVIRDIAYKNDMKFHSSWDWLMPVVEKIGKEYPVRITWLANSMEVTYIDRDEFSTDDSIADYGGYGAKGNTYKCVVDYIKWHNQKFKKNKK